jgi:hypothetical protein
LQPRRKEEIEYVTKSSEREIWKSEEVYSMKKFYKKPTILNQPVAQRQNAKLPNQFNARISNIVSRLSPHRAGK